MIDFKKFYNAKFYDSDMNPVAITEASMDLASTAVFMTEYDFLEIPDLPLPELVNTLIMELPPGFIFVRSSLTIVNIALENVTKRIRPDINFIDPFGDIDKDWYDWAVPALLLNNSQSAHELYTAWKLTNDGVACGLIGFAIGFHDTGVVKKNTSTFSATESNWQVVDTYRTISTRLLAEYCPELVHPNFMLLLAKAWLKVLDFEKNWLAFRTSAINKFLVGHIALTLNPNAEHDIKSIANQIDYPRYPGLIIRDNHEIYFSYKALL
jgi:hypothetical protein